MFDVGFGELVLLFVIGLLILGPERLPRVAAKIGRWVGRARRTATQLRMQFEREMTMQDIMRQQRKPPRTNEAKSEEAMQEDAAQEDPKSEGAPGGDEHATTAAAEPANTGQVAGEQARAPETAAPDREQSTPQASAGRGDEGR